MYDNIKNNVMYDVLKNYKGKTYEYVSFVILFWFVGDLYMMLVPLIYWYYSQYN